MEQKLTELIGVLETLKKTVDESNLPEDTFDKLHGWNQVFLDKDDIKYVVSNFIHKLKAYGDNQLTEGLVSTIDSHIDNITRLNTNLKSYFTNNASHLLHSVPSTLLTLFTIINDVDYELFSWENIQDKKLLPRGLSTRLRSTKTQLDSLDESSGNLKNKIEVINNAHEAAESLPTDLASLKEAKEHLETLLRHTNDELSTSKQEINTIKTDINLFRKETEKAHEEALFFKDKAEKSAQKASKLVAQCDDALQITTTEGLAAGFDQKAKELKNSIWVWIAGLLIALCAGAWIGAERVTAFTQVLENPLTAGQAILHTIMSVFSIGGPLWLAWISTQQINQRFKLSEDYSYKATVAKSFTGFSKFAERFDPSTEERLFNSTLDRLDEMPLRLIEGKDYNSPWHEFTDSESFKKAIDIVPNLAKEAGRFANSTKLKQKVKLNKKNPQYKAIVEDKEVDEDGVDSEKAT